MKARHIIHTVGPIWKGGDRGEDEKLAQCYRSCFELATAHGLKTIAFPAISTGAYGFPMDRATKIALVETKRFLEHDQHVEKAIFVCFDERALARYKSAFSEMFRGEPLPPGGQ